MEQNELTQKYYEVLKKHWGYNDFRPMQLDAIKAIDSGWDVLALMPTGAGKSLLYQVPALVKEGVCIVVTPLIALMKDQVDSLRKLGISAAAVHSGLATRQIDIILDNASWGDLKFLYVAPERLASYTFRERLRSMNVSILAVDEAHCISQWGYDFRPSYLQIAEIREMIPNTPVLALTASATPLVSKDIMRHLKMKEGRIIRSSFARPNLSFAVRSTDDKQGQLLRIINNVEGSGIIYVRTRDMTERLSQWLIEQGVSAEGYHAGMTYLDRSRKQERWMNNKTRIIVSTNAFGMGIDKANVRFVIHYDIPDSLEAYYQEAGRAGRDGLRSYAVLLTSSDDRGKFTRRFDAEFPPIAIIKECYEAVFNYLQIGIGDGKYASFNFNLHEFAGRVRIYSATAHNAIKILQQNGYMTLTDETDNPPRIMFVVGRDDLYRIRIEKEELDQIIRTLLRLYTGVFNYRLVAIDEQEIAQATGYEMEQVKELLKMLWQLRIIKYVPGSRSPILMLDEDRLPPEDVFISPESYETRKKMSIERVEQMFFYSENTTKCRSVVIQEYFGEEDVNDCGCCDICIENKKNEFNEFGKGCQNETITSQIKQLLSKSPLSVKQIIDNFAQSPDEVIETIDYLLEEGKVYAKKNGKIALIK